MNILTLDCEYNQPSQKTIQIGAAIFNVRSGNLIETLEMYINPQEPINPDITSLTGITDNDVKNGISILEGYIAVRHLHRKHQCLQNPLVWGSGVRNDSQHIYKESGILENNFMGYRVIDAKTLFQSLMMLENQSIRGGLEKSCKKLGIEFEGQKHTALADAINTFKIWHKLTNMLHDGYKQK